MAEAIACGKPVVATGYSGNLEFMDEASGYLVPYDLVEVPPTWWAHEPGATWAEPDVDAAAELMRRVWEHPEEAQSVNTLATAFLSAFHRDEPADFTRPASRVSERAVRSTRARQLTMRARPS